ncbi:MAG: SOS response-associated peptidase, partial [Myxococcota bacterium]
TPRYNIAPTQDVLGFRCPPEGAEREAAWFRWGLVPPGAPSLAVGARMINARSETIFTRPAFAHPVRTQRCLIPADGFIEWKTMHRAKYPFHIRLKSAEIFAMAGVWQRWQDSNGQTIQTCAIITTSANDIVRPIHDRMPVILQPADHSVWLDASAREEALAPLLMPHSALAMEAVPIDPWVNSVKHDDPRCLLEVSPPPEQLDLGL